jgi:hypothetical protein
LACKGDDCQRHICCRELLCSRSADLCPKLTFLRRLGLSLCRTLPRKARDRCLYLQSGPHTTAIGIHAMLKSIPEVSRETTGIDSRLLVGVILKQRCESQASPPMSRLHPLAVWHGLHVCASLICHPAQQKSHCLILWNVSTCEEMTFHVTLYRQCILKCTAAPCTTRSRFSLAALVKSNLSLSSSS